MNKKLTSITFAVVLLSSGTAMAGHRDQVEGDVYFDQAKVIRVDPIYTTVRYEEPREECYPQEVRTPVSNNHSTGTAILGGVIGGVVGHKLGHGKRGATIAGTILGAAIGKSAGRDGDRYTEHVSYENYCTTRVSYRTEERIDGYHVTYRYQGKIFTARMQHPPGEQLNIRVSVSPVVY